MDQTNSSGTHILLFQYQPPSEPQASVCPQTSIQNMLDWFARLKEEGKLVYGAQLNENDPVGVRLQDGCIKDGPYIEAKEILVGFFVLKVGSKQEAVDIAKACPNFHPGFSIHVRALDMDRS